MDTKKLRAKFANPIAEKDQPIGDFKCQMYQEIICKCIKMEYLTFSLNSENYQERYKNMKCSLDYIERITKNNISSESKTLIRKIREFTSNGFKNTIKENLSQLWSELKNQVLNGLNSKQCEEEFSQCPLTEEEKEKKKPIGDFECQMYQDLICQSIKILDLSKKLNKNNYHDIYNKMELSLKYIEEKTNNRISLGAKRIIQQIRDIFSANYSFNIQKQLSQLWMELQTTIDNGLFNKQCDDNFFQCPLTDEEKEEKRKKKEKEEQCEPYNGIYCKKERYEYYKGSDFEGSEDERKSGINQIKKSITKIKERTAELSSLSDDDIDTIISKAENKRKELNCEQPSTCTL